MVKIKKYISSGFPRKIEKELNHFKNIVDELSVVKGCIMFRDRVYIPESLRKDILNLFHEGHPGISAMKQLVRSLLWFPGIEKTIENFVKSCESCKFNRAKPSQNAIKEWPKPFNKWSRLHIDHFFMKIEYF